MKNNLTALREATPREEVAKIIGVSPSHYAYIERGKRIPSLPVALKIADHFKKSVEEIFILEE